MTDFKIEKKRYDVLRCGDEATPLAAGMFSVRVELDVFLSGKDSTKAIEEQLLQWAGILVIEEGED